MIHWDCTYSKEIESVTQEHPRVRASPRAPGYGGGTGGATVNIGSGPRLYTVIKDTKGNGMGQAKELPPQ